MNGREAVGRLQKCLSGRSGLSSRLKKYKWVGLVLLVGLLLLAWPAGKENQAETAAETPQTFDLAATEARLAEALSQIRGAGEVTVVLTLAGGPRQVLAQDVDQATERGQDGGRPWSSPVGPGDRRPWPCRRSRRSTRGRCWCVPEGETPPCGSS